MKQEISFIYIVMLSYPEHDSSRPRFSRRAPVCLVKLAFRALEVLLLTDTRTFINPVDVSLSKGQQRSTEVICTEAAASTCSCRL